MHGKILALGIIHSVIGHSGPTLRFVVIIVIVV
jgi:hypothetical protein